MSDEFLKKIEYLKRKCVEAEESYPVSDDTGRSGASFLMDIKRKGMEDMDRVEIAKGLTGELVMFDTDGSRIIISVLCSDFHKWLKSLNLE